MRRLLLIIALVLLPIIAGCRVAPYALSNHTLAVGPNQQTDVVWVVRDGRVVMRCFTDAQGPICMPAR